MARISKAAPKDQGEGLSNEQRINVLLQQGQDTDTIFFGMSRMRANLCTIDDATQRANLAKKYEIPCPEFDKIARQRLMEQIRKCKSKYKNDNENLSMLDLLREDDGSAKHVSEIKVVDIPRFSLGIPEIDEIIGKDIINGQVGMPVGACVIFGAEKGTGKTRLAVEIASMVGNPLVLPDARGNNGVLYVQNEEKLEIFRSRAANAWTKKHNILLSSSDDLIQQAALINKHRPKLVIVDSLQDTRQARFSAGMTGILSTYKAIAADLGCSFWIISHVNGEGGLKGGTYAGHKVDIVLFAEKMFNPSEFNIRCDKNRYGSSNKRASFMHTEKGVVAMKTERNIKFAAVKSKDLSEVSTDLGGVVVLRRGKTNSEPAGGLPENDDE